MAKLTRLTAKVFGETADGTLQDPEIGQFGSAKAGTYNGTGDVATIQSLPAWSNGWIDAVTPTQQFPPLPEMTGVHKVLSYQEAYLLQQGIPEWDSTTTYYTNGFCSKSGKIYISQSDSNLNNDPASDTVNWQEYAPDLSNLADKDLSNVTQTGKDNVIKWGMPDWANGVSKTLATLHTASKDCYVTVFGIAQNTAFVQLYVEDENGNPAVSVSNVTGVVWSIQDTAPSGAHNTGGAFIPKGYKYKSQGGAVSRLVEYPLKGAS